MAQSQSESDDPHDYEDRPHNVQGDVGASSLHSGPPPLSLQKPIEPIYELCQGDRSVHSGPLSSSLQNYLGRMSSSHLGDRSFHSGPPPLKDDKLKVNSKHGAKGIGEKGDKVNSKHGDKGSSKEGDKD